jgi:raffinose/stachyose/melibiose transport system substrate-binding protein
VKELKHDCSATDSDRRNTRKTQRLAREAIMVRHILSALICATAVVCIAAGCGRKQRDNADAPREPSQGGSEKHALTMWHIMNYSGPREIIDNAVAAFEQAHPDCTVKVQTFDNDAYKTKIAVEMASGTPPDILFTWGGGPLAEFARAGRVLDLTEHLEKDGWRDRFIDQAVDICSVDDRVFAVPLDLSAVLLWYNRSLFAGNDAEPPATFDDLLALVDTFRGKNITPLALGNMKQWPGAFYFIYLASRAGGTPLFIDAATGRKNARFDDPAFVAAGERLQQLVDNGAFSIGFNGIDVGQARTQFLTGKASMYLMGTWLVARAQSEAPEFMESLGCMPFPALADGRGDPATVVGGVNCGFAVSADCPTPDLAVDLLRELTSAKVAREWCDIGRIPALTVDAETEALLPAPTREALAHLKAAPALQPYYDQYLPPRLATEHKNTTQKLFAKTMTPQEAAESMAKTAESLK